jgi:hypothetical protein
LDLKIQINKKVILPKQLNVKESVICGQREQREGVHY